MSEIKYVYFFGGGKADGNGKMKDLLGGKGAGLAEMSNAGIPVPPGFTVTTEVCNIFTENAGVLPPEIEAEFACASVRIEGMTGRKFGDSEKPLLVSVRSGSKFSMPGMMDTILNLGLNGETVTALAKWANDERFAWDSFRRFIQMFGNVVLGIGKDRFEHVLSRQKKKAGVRFDNLLSAEDIKTVAEKYIAIVKNETGREFPSDSGEQLRLARNAVFKSWMNPRAREYRAIYNIPDNIGTAVNVQMMVFGNLNDKSATGVGFTRNPATGDNEFYGEFLPNAQGEDVVAGIRTPEHISELKKILPEAYEELRQITSKLERHSRDVQDFEFTIEDGKLWMLQTRAGKRTGHATVKIACDLLDDGIAVDEDEAFMAIDAGAIEQLFFPVFDEAEKKKFKPLTKGLNASPGTGAGAIAFTAEDAERLGPVKKRVVLVRSETSPEDIAGMRISEAVLTATGGMTSHAAVVSRQMGKPSVVGCSDLKIDYKTRTMQANGTTFKEGDFISVDGTTGEVFAGDMLTRPSKIIQVLVGKMKPEESKFYRYFDRVMKWADRNRKLGVRTNADRPDHASIAVTLGAEGIGLTRTEHMFFEKDRLSCMQEMILAENTKDREKAIKKLLPMQKKDFKGIFKAMEGRPVTIRTLDPPLHEFLPKRKVLIAEIATLKTKGKKKAAMENEKLLARLDELHEQNPMMGMRGCRLGINYPEITRMQARAIFEAAAELTKKGIEVRPEVMIPLVGIAAELEHQKKIVVAEAERAMKKYGVGIKYLVGTMIEVPRGALTADEVAKHADFFSFGTNDLTQMTFAFSRDDATKFIKSYQDANILRQDPFRSIDEAGVGQLMKTAVENGRKVRHDLKIGVCGEHGGDPDSIRFCHEIGLDYVSCSPYRVPTARLAAAQAALMKIAKERDR